VHEEIILDPAIRHHHALDSLFLAGPAAKAPSAAK